MRESLFLVVLAKVDKLDLDASPLEEVDAIIEAVSVGIEHSFNA